MIRPKVFEDWGSSAVTKLMTKCHETKTCNRWPLGGEIHTPAGPYYGVWLTGTLEPELAVVAEAGVAVEAFIAPALEASKVRGLNSRT